MYLSIHLSAFGRYISVWIQMKQKLKLDFRFKGLCAWRSTVMHFLYNLHSTLELYTETT
jgi:hypothetical protein